MISLALKKAQKKYYQRVKKERNKREALKIKQLLIWGRKHRDVCLRAGTVEKINSMSIHKEERIV